MADFPTDEAWAYFTKHLDDIRDCVAQFLPVPQWQSMVDHLVMKPRTPGGF